MRLSDIFIVFLYFPWSSGKHAFSGSLGIGAINVSNVLFSLLSESILMHHIVIALPVGIPVCLFLYFTALHQRVEIHITGKQIKEYKSFRYA
jgi:hypothetical protein